MAAKPSRTINRLHFNDLDPLRFEDLCLHLVSRIDNWKELNHFGRLGSDNGIDIEAIKEIDGRDYRTAVQCKRYINITKRDIDELVGKIKNSGKPPHQLLLILSCGLSKSNHDYLKELVRDAGIIEVKVWTASIIEAMLYKDFKDLLFVYFGVNIEQKQRDNAASIRYAIKMEKRMTKDFLRHEWLKDFKNMRSTLYDSTLKFVSDRVIVHSIDDIEYPAGSETANWFRTHLYDFYHNGLELWLAAGMGFTAIMDEKGFWELITDYHDPRKEDTKYKAIPVKMIGRVRFADIVDYKMSDGYYNEPHLYCRFEYDGWPYEEVYYKTCGDLKTERPDWELPKEKQTTFPNLKERSSA